MYYYAKSNEKEEYAEAGFFESDKDLKNGGALFNNAFGYFVVIGYSESIDIGIGRYFGTVDLDDPNLYSATDMAEKDWIVTDPVEIKNKWEVLELYRKYQNAPVMEYFGPAPRYIYIDNGELPF